MEGVLRLQKENKVVGLINLSMENYVMEKLKGSLTCLLTSASLVLFPICSASSSDSCVIIENVVTVCLIIFCLNSLGMTFFAY